MIEIYTDEFLYSEDMNNLYIQKSSDLLYVYCNKNFFDYKLSHIKYRFNFGITTDSTFKYKKHFHKKEFFPSFVKFLCELHIFVARYINPNHFYSIKEYISLYEWIINKNPLYIAFLNQHNVSKKENLRLLKLAYSKDKTCLDNIKMLPYKKILLENGNIDN